jgi:hypothetical protein
VASYAASIGSAVASVLSGLGGAPPIVEFRKADVLHPREGNNAAIVTVRRIGPDGRAFEGTILKNYGVQVAVYRDCQGDVSTGTDINPSFVQAAKQALDLASLSGVSAVWDVDLVEDDAWEPLEFKNGVEKSVFGLLVRTSEPQNG